MLDRTLRNIQYLQKCVYMFGFEEADKQALIKQLNAMETRYEFLIAKRKLEREYANRGY